MESLSEFGLRSVVLACFFLKLYQTCLFPLLINTCSSNIIQKCYLLATVICAQQKTVQDFLVTFRRFWRKIF
jgi:hypothetical protein